MVTAQTPAAAAAATGVLVLYGTVAPSNGWLALHWTHAAVAVASCCVFIRFIMMTMTMMIIVF